MTIPPFYKPERVGKLFVPDTPTATKAGMALNCSPASDDDRQVVLLLVDAQVDFIHADGALSVPGAIDDTRRTIEWIFRNTDKITTIAASLDSHVPIQIFSPTWWVNDDGDHPTPFTPITPRDVETGKWQPLYDEEWSSSYVQKLQKQAKKDLMIWPFHTLIGTPGHSLTPALYEAIAYHSAARQTQPIFLSKGSIPQTEHYSMMEPEVKVPGERMGELNVDFLNMLATHDLIYIAGQAKSHCVLETTTSIMRYFGTRQDIIDRLRILEDCMSSVAHPDIDFDAMANETFAEYAQKGLKIVRSTDPIG